MAERIRIGFIGAGGIALSNHMPAFQAWPDRCELTAVCDVREEMAQAAADKFSIPNVYGSYEMMLSDVELDAVVVATPNRLHVRPTLDALGKGLHVLCEKPLATSAADARAMCVLAKEAGKVLQVGLQVRFTGPARFVKQMTDGGELGFVYYARAHALRRRGVPSWGSFIDREAQGGGPLIDLGVHLLDLTLWLMGHPKPVSASGQTWNRLGTNPQLFNQFGDYDRSKFTIEDFAAGFIRFENGSAISLEASFMGNLEGNPYQTQLFGDRAGVLLKPFAADEPVKIYSERDRQLFDMTPVNVPKVDTPHVDAAAAFLDALAGKPCQIPGEQGLVLNAIFDALYKSAETGKEQPVSL